MTMPNTYDLGRTDTPHVIIDGVRVPLIRGGAFDDPPGVPDDLGTPPGDPAPPSNDLPADLPSGAPTSPPPGTPPAAPEGFIPRDAYDRLAQQDRARRERYQPYEQVFSRLDQDRAEALLALAEMYAEDPDNATQFLASIFAQDPNVPPGMPGAPNTPPDAPQFVTRDDLEDFFRNRDQQMEQARRQAESSERLRGVATELGFEYGSPDWKHLVNLAATNHRVDEFGVERDPLSALKAAKAAIDDQFTQLRQAAIDEYIAGKSGPTARPVTAGEPASGEKIPENMDEARRAFQAATFGPQ